MPHKRDKDSCIKREIVSQIFYCWITPANVQDRLLSDKLSNCRKGLSARQCHRLRPLRCLRVDDEVNLGLADLE